VSARQGQGITDFGKNESEIFFRQGLDNPNHVEILHEIAVLAHASLRDFLYPSGGAVVRNPNDLRQLGQII